MYLWTSIPALYFDESEFSKLHSEKRGDKFLEFVKKVLFLRWDDENIRKFHFSTDALIERSHVNEWIFYATKRSVQGLVLQLSTTGNVYKQFEPPHHLFDCGSLRVLKLDIQAFLKLQNPFSLSGLKSLHVRSVISTDDSLGKLISSCPVLEDLYLEACHFHSLNISSCLLKKLIILRCGWAYECAKFQVSAQVLLSFKFNPGRRGRIHQFFLENLVFLVEADIEIYKLGKPSDYSMTIDQILGAISNVSVLNFSYRGFEHLCLQQEWVGCLPEFHNLAYLKLNTWFNKDHIELIIYILQQSVNLKNLIINNEGPYDWFGHEKEANECCWTSKEPSPRFFHHIKEIVFENFKSSAIELNFVNFLRNTRV